jgi:hypothetical protein
MLNSARNSQNGAFVKKGKKGNRKAGGEDQPAEEIEIYPSQVYNSSFRDEEDLVDYEPESPSRISAGENDISRDYDQIAAHRTGIAFYTGVNDFYQPLRDFYTPFTPFTPLYASLQIIFAKQQHKSAIIFIWFWRYYAQDQVIEAYFQ